MKRAAIVLAAIAVLLAVFWLKVEHAVGVCAEAGGRWADWDCRFDERR